MHLWPDARYSRRARFHVPRVSRARDSVSAQYRSSGDTLFITGYHVAGIDTAFVSGSAVDMPFTYPENAEGPARRIHHFRR